MKYAGTFILATVLLAYLAFAAGSYVAKIPLFWCSVSTAGLAFAYAFRNPNVFCKRPNGTIAILGYVLYWPYFLLNYFSLWLFRRFSDEGPISEIVPGVYLGCRLFSSDRGIFQSKGIASTLDLTAEFSEPAFVRVLDGYRCLPVLDTDAPSPEQLRAGADWIERRIERGSVFVHCALGHGRSATMVAAFLLKSGVAASAEGAVALVREHRPKIGLHPKQHAVLEHYAEYLED
jgi:hypothetical protein